jgi:hypothetical protein
MEFLIETILTIIKYKQIILEKELYDILQIQTNQSIENIEITLLYMIDNDSLCKTEVNGQTQYYINTCYSDYESKSDFSNCSNSSNSNPKKNTDIEKNINKNKIRLDNINQTMHILINEIKKLNENIDKLINNQQ